MAKKAQAAAVALIFSILVVTGITAGYLAILKKPAPQADQISQLEQGGYYINIHTASHISGEIRGQLNRTG